MSDDSPIRNNLKDEFQFRLDLVTEESELVEETDDGVVIQQAMRPEPERYDYVEEEGKEGWIDTDDNTFIP
jgi:hypothetical protein